MLDQRQKSLKIFAIVQAVLGGVIAAVVFAYFGLGKTLITDAATSLGVAVLGTAAVVYFLTLHQLVGRKRPGLSTLVLSIISSTNLILIITATGGLDSPFYSLWLLAIVAGGIFGTTETIALMVITLLYYGFAMVSQGFDTPFLRDHLVQFGITLIAGGLAQWIHLRSHRAAAATNKLETLSGQLSTEQLKAETIMSSIGEGVMVIDGSRKIQLFNKAAQDLAGWDESSAQNIDFNLVMQLKTSDDKPVVEANDPVQQAWTKGETVVCDNLTMTSRSGRKVQISLSISPIKDGQGQSAGAIALFRDISEEKEVARQKDEFVSTASHEMRTPVAAIEGYISLAMNANVATIDDRAMKYLTKAHETIGHLGELFRDLLSVTKAEEGQLGGKIEAVNLAKLVQDATDDMQFSAQKKTLTLVYQIGDATGKAIAPLYYVAVNPERLREVIMNLMDNAIKFTPQGGIKVTLDGNDKEVTVGVSDTGVGIAKEDAAHLFQKFYRIDNTATRTIGGTGLGLYLCRRVIELFNGRIWVESKPNEGATFKFSLPRLSQTEAERMINSAATPASTEAAAGNVVQPAKPVATPLPEPGPALAPIPMAVPSALPAKQKAFQDIRRKVQ